MSDWENDDWETKDVVVPGAATGLTASEALLKNNGYDASKFQDEEEEEDDEPKYVVPQTQPKKERVSKYAHKESMGLQPNVGDVTDKLEQQRLQEQAELAMMGDTFGTGGLNELDKFVPKTQDDFDNYARMVASRYITSFFGKPGAHYKVMVKSLVKEIMGPCSAADLRDFSKEVAQISKNKDKEEKEKADALKRKGKKVRELKVESDDLTAGLEGDHYDDDYADDFM